jgi:pimeloyl-ACP methyl ester carboxylesterase
VYLKARNRRNRIVRTTGLLPWPSPVTSPASSCSARLGRREQPRSPKSLRRGVGEMPPETRYAKSGEFHIAYQVFGDGPVNLVVTPPFVSNVEHYWELPEMSRWLLRIGNYARVAIFDKRGTGMSDRAAELPGLDERIDDLRAVMDAAGMGEAALLGFSEGGALAALFAATYPVRTRALVLYGSYACDADWRTDEQFERALRYAAEAWGSGNSLQLFVPSRAGDPALQNWWRRLERLGASPKAASDLARMNRLIDVTGVLHAIKAPTLVIHRTGDLAVAVACGRVFAKSIPDHGLSRRRARITSRLATIR